MDSMELLLSENYMIRKDTLYKKNRGTLGITNYRVIWTPLDSHINSQMFPHSKIRHIDQATNTEKKESYMQIELNFRVRNRPKTVIFTFTSNTHREDLEICFDHINSYMRQEKNIDESLFMPPDAQKKMRMLNQDSTLSELHKLLVREGKLPEEEFWKSVDPYQAYVLEKKIENQKLGRMNNIVRLPHRYDTAHENQIVVDMDMLNKYKELVFRQFPKIQHDFKNKVPHKKSELDYWKHFWEERIQRGLTMSDALELLPENQLHSISSSNEIFPKYIGNFRQKYPQSNSSSEIMSKINRHSAHVLEGSKLPPSLTSLEFPPFFSLPKENAAMIEDAPAPGNFEWKQSIHSIFAPENREKCTLKQNEAVEAIKHIRKQTIVSLSDESSIDHRSLDLTRKVYETLKFFYKYFPVRDIASLDEMRKILDLAGSLIDQMRDIPSEAANRANAMFQAASNRFNYLSSVFISQ